jgi:predicted amidohydrolase
VLARWQEALRSRRTSPLRYVLAGSGNVFATGARAANTAVLLDADTGEVIGHQPKLSGFTMTPEILERWGLISRLGDRTVAEDLAVVPRRVRIFDLGAIRVAVLVCEDLNRPIDIGAVIRDFGVSHLLVPVFSRPIQKHRWEQAAAGVHVVAARTTVIVANSLVMGTLEHTPDPGTGLVVSRDGNAHLGRAAGPADLVTFHLSPDGAAELR